jgi:hypothetical protein
VDLEDLEEEDLEEEELEVVSKKNKQSTKWQDLANGLVVR